MPRAASVPFRGKTASPFRGPSAALPALLSGGSMHAGSCRPARSPKPEAVVAKAKLSPFPCPPLAPLGLSQTPLRPQHGPGYLGCGCCKHPATASRPGSRLARILRGEASGLPPSEADLALFRTLRTLARLAKGPPPPEALGSLLAGPPAGALLPLVPSPSLCSSLFHLLRPPGRLPFSSGLLPPRLQAADSPLPLELSFSLQWSFCLQPAQALPKAQEAPCPQGPMAAGTDRSRRHVRERVEKAQGRIPERLRGQRGDS